MKKVSLFLTSLASAVLAVFLYAQFSKNETSTTVVEKNVQPVFQNVSLTKPTADAVSDFTIAAEKTINAVVHVTNFQERSGFSLFDFMYGSSNGGYQNEFEAGTGSGVIISPDGYIVTNTHVIKNSSNLNVTLNNKKSYKASVVGSDAEFDIALIKIETEDDLPFLAFGNSDSAQIGEWVLAVGNPFNLTSTVTAGIISAKARSLSERNPQSFIQTDAAINPGNSGGALVNTNGDLIGINTAISSRTGSYVGYSFAVPSNIAKKVVEDLLEYGKVQKGILGISTMNENSSEALELGLDQIEGVYVANVSEDSGAEKAGIKEGDIIKKVNGVKIGKFSALVGYLSSKRPGEKVKVAVERNGNFLEFDVELSKLMTVDLRNLGLRVKDLTEEDQKNYKRKTGVKIVAASQSYRNYSLEGKLLIAINDNEIKDINDAEEQSNALRRNKNYYTALTLIDENGEKERILFD